MMRKTLLVACLISLSSVAGQKLRMGDPKMVGTCAPGNSPEVSLRGSQLLIKYEQFSINSTARTTCSVHIPAEWEAGYHVVIRKIKMKGSNDLTDDSMANLQVSITLPWSNPKAIKLPANARREHIFRNELNSKNQGQFEKDINGINLYSACGSQGFMVFQTTLSPSSPWKGGTAHLESLDIELELVPCSYRKFFGDIHRAYIPREIWLGNENRESLSS